MTLKNKKIYLFGNRIPAEYFITGGVGESSVGSKGLPFETGSYDAALNDAGIENVNVIKYTSVIPTHAREISKTKGLKAIQWGEVMECIMAQANGIKGEKITAAVITSSVTDKNNRHLGGFACEYSGSGTKEEVERSLSASIIGMIERRGYGQLPPELKLYTNNKTDLGYTVYPGKSFIFKTLDVKAEHGTVLASICFSAYQYPQYSRNIRKKKTRKRRSKK